MKPAPVFPLLTAEAGRILSLIVKRGREFSHDRQFGQGQIAAIFPAGWFVKS
jgi:hypothetical protein